MGNAVLQELFGPLSNDLNALADLATAVALFAAIGSYRLAVKQMRNDRSRRKCWCKGDTLAPV